MAQELVVFPIQRSPYVFNIGTTKRQRVANTAGTAAYCFCREGKCQAANVAVVGPVLDQANAVRLVGVHQAVEPLYVQRPCAATSLGPQTGPAAVGPEIHAVVPRLERGVRVPDPDYPRQGQTHVPPS